jgi:hypothetical protein
MNIFKKTLGNIALEANRISTLLFMWTLLQEIELRANKIVNDKQEELCLNVKDKESSAAGSKKGKQSKFDRQLAFKKQRLLSKLRVSEEEITSTSQLPNSLHELKMRQGEGKHLFHISDDVFNFFLSLNKKLQCHLSDKAFHYDGKNIHCKCKLAIQSDEIMEKEWCDLFDEAPGIDDSNENAIEIFTAVLLDLNEMMTDYFIKIALSNGLKRFKSTIPKTK